jgi:septal ring factor EnvC (AmiA/AmiB activator)
VCLHCSCEIFLLLLNDMNDKVENLVIEILRKIQGDISAFTEGQKATNQRLSSIEHQMAGVEHHMAAFHETAAGHSDEMELLRSRVARIERRLELRDD